MKTKGFPLKLGAELVLALLLGLSFAAGQEKQTVLSGKQVYEKKCASCHGRQGEGNPKIAKTLKTTIRNWGEITAPPDTLAAWKKLVVEGKGKMPAFKNKLSAAEIDSVAAYVKALTKTSNPAKEAKPDSAKAVGK